MDEITKVELVFSGAEVEDGKIPVKDLLDALAGFSAAFEKVAADEMSGEPHTIRVVGVEKTNSSKIGVEILQWARDPAAAPLITAVGMVLAGAYMVVKDIAGVMNGRKALKGEKVANNYTATDNGIIINGDVNLTVKQFGYLQSRELDDDLEKLTRPLEKGRGVDEFKMTAAAKELVRVESKERGFFYANQSIKTTRDGVWLEGTLNSHSKTSNRGTFHIQNGSHVRYHYIGEDEIPLLSAYVHQGLVRVLGRVTYQDEQPTFIDIREIHPMHPVGQLPFDGSIL